MSLEAVPSGEAGLHIEVLSPQEIRKRARQPQSSGLSSSLAKGIARTTSLPGQSTTPTSLLQESRLYSADSGLDSFRQSNQESVLEAVVDAQEEEIEEDISPSSRPIAQRPKKAESTAIATAESPMDKFMPPHMMSLPTFKGKQDEQIGPGSLFEGAGRKLRGRDAVRFRRSVMQQTGFLENATAENTVH